jgi:hypothetical protein
MNNREYIIKLYSNITNRYKTIKVLANTKNKAKSCVKARYMNSIIYDVKEVDHDTH